VDGLYVPVQHEKWTCVGVARSRILQTTIFILFQNVVRIRPQDQSNMLSEKKGNTRVSTVRDPTSLISFFLFTVNTAPRHKNSTVQQCDDRNGEHNGGLIFHVFLCRKNRRHLETQKRSTIGYVLTVLTVMEDQKPIIKTSRTEPQRLRTGSRSLVF